MRSTNRRLSVCVPVFSLACLVGQPAHAQSALCSSAKLVASDGSSDDGFGRVALSGDTAVIGAPRASGPPSSSGAAYVRVRQGATWAHEAKLIASDAGSSDFFGYSVAIDGDTAVVGAVLDDAVGFDSGSAYVFVRSAGVWSEQAKLLPSDLGASDQCGYAVAVDGDTLAVGAIEANGNVSDSGAVYVFARSGSTWTEQAKLSGPPNFGGSFGRSVAIEGDTLVVGDDTAVGFQFGRAFVFRRSGSTWTQIAELVSNAPTTNDAFGCSVAIAADTVVVGARGATGYVFGTGAAFVFRESAGTWSLEAKLFQPLTEYTGGDLYGWSVAVDGDRAIVSALSLDWSPTNDVGAVYVYDRFGTAWKLGMTLAAPDPRGFPLPTQAFGVSVAVDGEHVLVGATADDALGTDSGSVYAFGPSPFVRFCFGDGSLPTPCPCAAPHTVPSPSGAPGAGCAASFNLDGGRLTACGELLPDTLRFFGELRHNFASFAQLVKGNVNHAEGGMSGDGLRCADGQLLRFGGHIAGTNGDNFGYWSYPNAAQTLSVSAATLQPAGASAYYQLVFRSAQSGFCNPSTYNITNAVAVAW